MASRSDETTEPGSWSRSARTLALSLAVIGAITVGGVALVAFSGPGLAQASGNDTATLSAGNATVGVDGTATVDITLSNLSEGLSGYDLNVTLENPAVADITGASVNSELGLNETMVSEDGSMASLQGVDIQQVIQNDTREIVLGTVELTGVEAGESGLALTDINVDNETGFNVDATVENATLTVGAGGENTTAGTNGAATTTESIGTDTATVTVGTDEPMGAVGTDTATETPAPSTTTTASEPVATGTAMAGEGGTVSPDETTGGTETTGETTDGTDTTPDETTGGTGPGVGVLGALVAVLGGVLLTVRARTR